MPIGEIDLLRLREKRSLKGLDGLKITSGLCTLVVIKIWRDQERRLYAKEKINTIVVDKLLTDVDKFDFNLYIYKEGTAIPSQSPLRGVWFSAFSTTGCGLWHRRTIIVRLLFLY